MALGHGFASRLRTARHVAIRPPLLGGLVVAVIILGVIVWLAVAGRDQGAATDGQQVRIPLQQEEHEAAPAPDEAAESEAPPPAEAARDEPRQEEAAVPDPTTPPVAAEGEGEAAPPPPAESILPAEPAPDTALAPVDPVLLRPSAHGPLPVIGPDGRRSWQVYARPFAAAEGTPRLAIVVAELGFNQATTEAAIKLPPEVTLSFSPYAPELAALVAKARQAGHEVLLDLPMEPASYPADDPGPQALLTSLDAAGNIARLEQVLGGAQGYVGVISQMGSKFTTSQDALRPVLGALSERGLLFVDGKTSTTSVAATLAEQLKLPSAANDRFLDNEATRMAIDDELSAVEGDARRAGVALGVARPFPVSLQRLAAWLPTLASRGIALAPVSAVIDQQAEASQ
ncbi:MAG: divergent polysaccharide deacetylase family protein [Alphaproteobacteria bacterium]